MKIKINFFLFIILCLLLPVSLTLSNALLITYTPSTYQKLLMNNKNLTLSQRDRKCIAQTLYIGIVYQRSIQVQLENGKVAFSEKEIMHMLDVGRLVKKLTVFLAFLYLISGVLLIWLLKNTFRLLKYLPLISILLSIGFLGLILFNFSSSFTLFHHLSFQNQFWLLDPSKDLLISLFPESFFILQFTKVIILTILELLFMQFLVKLFFK